MARLESVSLVVDATDAVAGVLYVNVKVRNLWRVRLAVALSHVVKWLLKCDVAIEGPK